MTIEKAFNRINKIQNEMIYSQNNLNNKLGFNNKENSQCSLATLDNWQVR